MYDSSCHDLAQSFLEDYGDREDFPKLCDQLAQAIQTTIEDFLGGLEQQS